jgi:K+-transporting ATPase ATPase C chain
MWVECIKQIKTAILLLIVFSILLGLLYPAIVTGVAQLFFPWRANGSMLMIENNRIGSQLIGQSFTDPKYFWGRPSVTTPVPYNALSSRGSNLGPTNTEFYSIILARSKVLRDADPAQLSLIPSDLVMASASGLDPEISPLAAQYQIARVAKLRRLSVTRVTTLVIAMTQPRLLSILGEPSINVLQLNMALDALDKNSDVKVQ